MALKLRGSSQIDDRSIELSKLVNINHGTILGRASEGSGKPEALTASQARTELGLSDSDAVSFGSMASTNITVGAGKSLVVSAGTLTLADDQISGDKIAGGDISGDLTLSGSSVDVSNALSAGSFSSSNVDIDGGAIDGTPIGANDHSTAKFTTLQATGNADLDGDLDVAGTTTVVALTSSGLVNAASFHSDAADIDGGSIDDTVIGGSSAAAGTFTSLESSGNLVVGGNLTVNGASTTIESATLSIEDPILHLGKDNDDDIVDLGLVGKYNDGSDNYWTGLLRDASDEKFKLFSTQEDLSSANSVNTSAANYSKGTLVSTIEGNITFDNARTFSLSGDLSGSQTFDGSGNCAITATIQDDSVEFSMLGCEIDEDDMSSDSASHVPTQQSVKAYVDSQVASGGLSDLSAKDMQMVDSTGSFIAVHEEYQFFNVSATDESNNYVTASTAVETEFKDLSNVYLNGQKLRYSSNTGTTNDYWFTESGPSATLHATTLTASDQSASDVYTAQGISMSDDGTVLAVGSQLWDRAGGGSNHGGVYIYDWNSVTEVWDQRGDVFSPPSDATNGVMWGHSVSLSSDGSYMAVGSVLHTESVSQQGGVFVYEWNDSTSSWDSHGSVAVAIDAGFGDRHIMGSLSGNASVLAVGAFSWDGASKTNDGKVYIYDWDSTDEEWDQRTVINASDAASYDYFGIDVSLSNDASILAIGASGWEGDTEDQGGVYIYDWTDTNSDGNPDTFVQRGDVIESNNPSVNGHFGYGVELNNAGTTLIVGSQGAGKAEIFNWNSATSSWDHAVTVSDPVSGGVNFGGSVAIDSNSTKFVVGSYGNGSTIAGRAHTYDLSNSSSTNKINFSSGLLDENDKLEVRYLVKS